MSIGNHIRLSGTAKLFLLFFAVVIISNSLYRHYGRMTAKQFVIGSDMEGYYQYLPHLFLKDIEEMRNMRWAKPYGEGRRLSAFTCGVAIMQMPFFLVGHGVSKFLEMESDGHNPAYFMSVLIAALFYAFIGLYYLYKALKRLFSHRTALIISLMAFLATNLYYYTIMSPGMSHVYSFCLVSVFIYFVPGFYANPGFQSSLKVIFPLALAVLIRPTTIVAGLYLLLYDIRSWKELGKRFYFLAQKWHLLIFMLIVSLLIFSPQMAYWHYVTGKWFIYSYQDESFTNALSPKIYTVLFGPRNGWYIYTPLMLVSTLVLFYLVYVRRLSAVAILTVMVLIIYINASWWRPTFSAAAGYRTLVEYIPFMAIPLGFLVENTFGNKTIRWLLMSLFIVFLVYNILFAFKYSGHIWWNMEWQWSNFLRLVRF